MQQCLFADCPLEGLYRFGKGYLCLVHETDVYEHINHKHIDTYLRPGLKEGDRDCRFAHKKTFGKILCQGTGSFPYDERVLCEPHALDAEKYIRDAAYWLEMDRQARIYYIKKRAEKRAKILAEKMRREEEEQKRLREEAEKTRLREATELQKEKEDTSKPPIQVVPLPSGCKHCQGTGLKEGNPTLGKYCVWCGKLANVVQKWDLVLYSETNRVTKDEKETTTSNFLSAYAKLTSAEKKSFAKLVKATGGLDILSKYVKQKVTGINAPCLAPSLSAMYTPQFRNLHSRLAPNVPIDRWYTLVGSKLEAFRNPSNVFLPVELSVRLVNVPSGGAVKFRVSPTDKDWHSNLSNAVSSMIGSPATLQTFSGVPIKGMNHTQLAKVGELVAVAKDGSRLYTDQIKAPPKSMSTNKVQEIESWHNDLRDTIVETIVKELTPLSFEQVKVALNKDGPIHAAIASKILESQKNWSEFLKTFARDQTARDANLSQGTQGVQVASIIADGYRQQIRSALRANTTHILAHFTQKQVAEEDPLFESVGAAATPGIFSNVETQTMWRNLTQDAMYHGKSALYAISAIYDGVPGARVDTAAPQPTTAPENHPLTRLAISSPLAANGYTGDSDRAVSMFHLFSGIPSAHIGGCGCNSKKKKPQRMEAAVKTSRAAIAKAQAEESRYPKTVPVEGTVKSEMPKLVPLDDYIGSSLPKLVPLDEDDFIGDDIPAFVPFRKEQDEDFIGDDIPAFVPFARSGMPKLTPIDARAPRQGKKVRQQRGPYPEQGKHAEYTNSSFVGSKFAHEYADAPTLDDFL